MTDIARILTSGFRIDVEDFTMVRFALVFALTVGLAYAQCPFTDPGRLAARDDEGSRSHLTDHEVEDGDGYLSSDAGGPIEDQGSLKAGDRGPTLLEDFIFRQKITHFDHERVSFMAHSI